MDDLPLNNHTHISKKLVKKSNKKNGFIPTRLFKIKI